MAVFSCSKSVAESSAWALRSKKYFLRSTQQRVATSVEVVKPAIKAWANYDGLFVNSF